MTKQFQIGDSVYIAVIHETYTLATNTWAVANPDTNFPKITILDPDGEYAPLEGEEKVNAVTMSKMDDGMYEYEYELHADAPKGQWRVYIDVENDTYPNRQFGSFTVH